MATRYQIARIKRLYERAKKKGLAVSDELNDTELRGLSYTEANLKIRACLQLFFNENYENSPMSKKKQKAKKSQKIQDFEDLKKLVFDYIEAREAYLKRDQSNRLSDAESFAYDRLKEWVEQNKE